MRDSRSRSTGRLVVAHAEDVERVDLAALPRRRATATSAGGEGYFDPPTTALDEDGQGAPYATYGSPLSSPRSKWTSNSAR